MTETETEILKRVRARIEDPRRWTSGASARTADGQVCAPDHRRAACWCLVGALLVETELSWEENREELWTSLWEILCQATLKWYGVAPQVFNDEAGHSAVLALLNRLISGERAARGKETAK